MMQIAFGMTLLLAIAIIGIGAAYVFNPYAATRSFGLPLPEGGANFSWWLRLKGVRDTTSGLVLLGFMVWGTNRGLGLLLLIQALIPVGDMLVVLAAKGSAKSAFAIHGVTAVVMVGTAMILLAGGY